MKSGAMLILSQDDCRQAVSIADALVVARDTFVGLARGEANVPPRPHLDTPHGTTLVMPAYRTAGPQLGVKLVTVTPGNAAGPRPVVQAVVLLVDERSGAPVALMEGTYLTALRTGAAIGLAADLLATPEAAVVALFGVGATARTSLAAVGAVRPVRQVRVVHPHAERFPAFASAMRALLGPACPALQRVESPAAAVAGAAIVITATTSRTPVFPGAALSPGVYVGALGAYTPTMRELDSDTVRRARLVVDTRAGALREAGDLLIPIQAGELPPDPIWAELGEILLGTRPGRTAPDEVFVFKSVGNAMQDLTLATRIYDQALARGLGTTVQT
jgi:ornithine cyclodeaminase/alanine dehydrogenase-like protein (mu-crystallin family)